jgi:hypothetical protein
MPAKESEYQGGGKLYPEYPAGYRGLTVPTATTKPEVTKYRDVVFGS